MATGRAGFWVWGHRVSFMWFFLQHEPGEVSHYVTMQVSLNYVLLPTACDARLKVKGHH